MEPLNARINLYVKRSFSEKINVTFDFIKGNWKTLFKCITFLLLPLSLLQAISLNSFAGAYMELIPTVNKNDQAGLLGMLPMLMVKYALCIFFIWIGLILLTSLVYALMKSYNERENGLDGITLKELRPLLMRNIGRMFKLTLFMGLLFLIFSAIVGMLLSLLPLAFIPIGVGIIMPLYLVVMVPIAFFAPIYLFEKISLIAALKKTFRLGFATWGGLFAVMFVMGFIASILQGVISTPWMVALMVKHIFNLNETGIAAYVSTSYNLAFYLFAILQCFGMYIANTLLLTSTAYQYGHASEVVDSISVADDIDNFEKL